MFPARIQEYLRPRSVAEALAAITRYDAGDAIFLAGGQSAMQAIKSRMLRPQCVVDLQGIAELKGVSVSNGALTIGAMTRYVEIAGHGQLDGAFAALRDATSHVGDRQVRNRGTIGGSVCWNYVAACTPTAVLATGGRMNLIATSGATRSLAADDFLLGPLETARQDDELLLSVSWDAPAARTGSAYAKWGLVTDALPVIARRLHGSQRTERMRDDENRVGCARNFAPYAARPVRQMGVIPIALSDAQTAGDAVLEPCLPVSGSA